MIDLIRKSVLILCLTPFAAWAQDGTTTTTNTESSRSNVGLFVEPILLYSRDDVTIKTSQLPIISDDTSGTSEAAGLGARLGFHLSEAIFLGADGRYSRTRMTDSSYGTAEGDSYSVGPTLGFQMPDIGVRIWGTALMLGGYDPKPGNQDFDVKFEDPRGFRAGVGFRIASVSVNLEYQDLTYDKTEVESFGLISGTASSDVDFENKGFTGSISFPMEL